MAAPHLSHLLDHYVSPKIVAGPYTSEASATARERLLRDRDYHELGERLARIGFFAPARFAYAWRMLVLAVLYLTLFAYLLSSPSLAPRIAACVAIGAVHTMCNFIAHDISHGAVSKSAAVTVATGQLFDTLLTGFSFTYFRRSHTLHHYHCNEDGYDPDTVSALWSVSEHSARGKRGLGRAATRVQHLVIPFLYVFWGAALKLQGVMYCLRNPRAARIDGVLLVVHAVAWCWLGAHFIGALDTVIDYAVMTMVVGVYLGLIFPVGHVGTASLDPGRSASVSFMEQQLATTRNVSTSVVRDLLFMGLNCQIEHHLFPWVASMRLGRARGIVRQFCAERCLPYEETSHCAAIGAMWRHLRRVSRWGRIGPPPSADE